MPSFNIALLIAWALLACGANARSPHHRWVSNSTTHSHRWNATKTSIWKPTTKPSNHTTHSWTVPTEKPCLTGCGGGGPETGTIVTVTTVIVTSLYPIPTDGPMPSAPYTPPRPGSRNHTRSPAVRGVGAWAGPVKRARQVVASLTLEERVNLTTGVGWTNGHCVGNIAPLASIGFPGLCLEDSPLGVRFADHVTAFPAGINAAATWDRHLIRERGVAMGAEFRGKGANIQLGPMMLVYVRNMGRNARGGRNWEGFGADPYLVGESAYETIIGIQSQVPTTANTTLVTGAEHNVPTQPKHERTMHDLCHILYAPPADVHTLYVELSQQCYRHNPINGTTAPGSYDIPSLLRSHHRLRELRGDKTSPVAPNTTLGTARTIADHAVNEAPPTTTRTITIGDIHSDFSCNFTREHPTTRQASTLRHPAQSTTNIIRQCGGNTHAASVTQYQEHQNTPRANQTTFNPCIVDAMPTPTAEGSRTFGGIRTPAMRGFNLFIGQSCQDDHRSWFSNNWDLETVGSVAQYQDVAIVFVNSDSGEGNEGDRNNLTSWYNGDALIQTVAANNPNTNFRIANPTMYQSSGSSRKSVAIILDRPYESVVSSKDNRTNLDLFNLTIVVLTDALIDYEHAMRGRIQARDSIAAPTCVIVTYNITNTGSVAGAEVSQLYLEFPPSAEEPPSVLRGFESTHLVPGETKLVTIKLSRYDLSVWNSVQQGWSRPHGLIGVLVGAAVVTSDLKVLLRREHEDEPVHSFI
ncbi:glycoside hydrolase family 3 protein [Hydnum rufescens UP504]|uniref:beta-glucosidase n=1 Tax=Hydnum rufescens UP504 TaxID=1448309 RepID=A0A9P6AVA9_9AGAM|nr:glycoside hydrolase family 3 protein [Hydnum rufescens UP504]